MNIFTCAKNTTSSGGGVADVAVNVHENLFNFTHRNYLLNGENFNTLSSIDSPECRVSFLNLVSKGDVVHLHGLWDPFLFRIFLISKLKGAKIVISPHGMLESEALKSSRIKKKIAWFFFQKLMIKFTDLIIVNSEREKENSKKLIKNLNKVVIPNGVNPELGIYDSIRNNPYILFLSRLDPIKGLPVLLEAWARVKNKKSYELVICGDGGGDYVSFLNGLIKKYDLAENTFMLGNVSGKYKWSILKNSNFFILPSYSENFGIAVAEALYSGVPVIVSNNTPWLNLEELGIGWNIDVDVECIRLALENAINISTAELAKFKSQAKQYSNNKFDWNNIASCYFREYSGLL